MDGIKVSGHEIPESELDERFDTPGGPGGQHANRNETAVTIRLDIASSSLPEGPRETLIARLGPVVETTASRSRSQWRNRALARKQLVSVLEEALVEVKPRRSTRPSRSAREKRLQEKRARSEVKRNRRKPDID
jgi:ribosome-associated protein